MVLPYAGYYTFDRIDLECQTFRTVSARSDVMSAESLQNTVLGTNSLTGEITVSEPKVLVVQIPYSTGWSATVDGQPAKLLRANTAFLGLELEPGSHTHRPALLSDAGPDRRHSHQPGRRCGLSGHCGVEPASPAARPPFGFAGAGVRHLPLRPVPAGFWLHISCRNEQNRV